MFFFLTFVAVARFSYFSLISSLLDFFIFSINTVGTCVFLSLNINHRLHATVSRFFATLHFISCVRWPSSANRQLKMPSPSTWPPQKPAPLTITSLRAASTACKSLPQNQNPPHQKLKRRAKKKRKHPVSK